MKHSFSMGKVIFCLAVVLAAFWLLFVQQQDEPTRDYINQKAGELVGR